MVTINEGYKVNFSCQCYFIYTCHSATPALNTHLSAVRRTRETLFILSASVQSSLGHASEHSKLALVILLLCLWLILINTGYVDVIFPFVNGRCHFKET